jgi:hypothetical protein
MNSILVASREKLIGKGFHGKMERIVFALLASLCYHSAHSTNVFSDYKPSDELRK